MPMERVRYSLKPVTGVWDALNPATVPEDRLSLGHNIYVDPQNRIWGRPAFLNFGPAAFTASSDSSGASQRTGIFQYGKTDGTLNTLVTWSNNAMKFSSGNWSAVTVPAGFFGDTTTANKFCEAVVLNNTLVIRGWTTMYTWNGTTFTALTGVPLMNSLTVYYGKIFGIKVSEPDTIVWSEENDPSTGYENVGGTFNNAWTLSQTGSAPLTALVGTNEALYYFRERSIGAVRGAVTTDFQNDGTREGVSETIGTPYPFSVVQANKEIWFLDREHRPYVLSTAGELSQDIWPNCEAASKRCVASSAAIRVAPLAAAHPTRPWVMFAVQMNDEPFTAFETRPNTLLVFDRETKQYMGEWYLEMQSSLTPRQRIEINGIAAVDTASTVNGRSGPRLIMHINDTDALLETGYAVELSESTQRYNVDQLNPTDFVAQERALHTRPLVYDGRYEHWFDTIDVRLWVPHGTPPGTIMSGPVYLPDMAMGRQAAGYVLPGSDRVISNHSDGFTEDGTGKQFAFADSGSPGYYDVAMYLNSVADFRLARLGLGTTITNLPTGTIPANKWAAFTLYLDYNLTLRWASAAANFTTGYATETAALKAAGQQNLTLAKVSIQAPAGGWVSGTSLLSAATSYTVYDSPQMLSSPDSEEIGSGTPPSTERAFRLGLGRIYGRWMVARLGHREGTEALATSAPFVVSGLSVDGTVLPPRYALVK